MDIGVQKDQMQNHQKTARLLMEQSETLKQLFEDQWVYAWSLNPDNLFVIHEEQHELSIADQILKVEFNPDSENIIQFSSPKNYPVQKIADHIFNEISFFISDSKSQDSLFLQSKVQVFRQLIVEEFFQWVDGENRVEEYLYNLTEEDAKAIDQLMIDGCYYQNYYLTDNVKLGKAIPLNVELNFKHLCLINSILGEDFLPVQKLIPLYEQLCFSARQFLPKPMYRIIQVLFKERFNFADIFTHQQDFKLLMNHANENPNLLAFTTWVKRGYWQYRDILSKESFLDPTSEYWDENLKGNFPICYLKRTVNWLFKQNPMVLDWVSKNIDDANVRVTITALSFIDTTKAQPEIILSVIKYFKSSAARFFVQECSQFAEKNNWFSDLEVIDENEVAHEQDGLENQSFILLEEELPASVLYIEEWLNLFSRKVSQDAKIAKLIFKQLNRVVQAYLSFLKGLIKDVPETLIYFIDPEKQQSPCFYHALKQHQLDANQFRKIFKHQNIHLNHNISVFDSYVADYLIDAFNQHKTIEKNVSWNGLYQQAVKWHEQVYFKDTLGKLRSKVDIESWQRVSPQKVMHYENWKFIELNSLEQIINESMTYKHCLALSYSELIASGQYVAFHMSSLSKDQNLNLTLGCFYKDEVLDFDQLRLPNNEKPANEVIEKAQNFVMSLNDQIAEINKNNS